MSHVLGWPWRRLGRCGRGSSVPSARGHQGARAGGRGRALSTAMPLSSGLQGGLVRGCREMSPGPRSLLTPGATFGGLGTTVKCSNPQEHARCAEWPLTSRSRFVMWKGHRLKAAEGGGVWGPSAGGAPVFRLPLPLEVRTPYFPGDSVWQGHQGSSPESRCLKF